MFFFSILYQIITENATVFTDSLLNSAFSCAFMYVNRSFFKQSREIHIFPFKYHGKYIIMYMYYWLSIICTIFCQFKHSYFSM